MSDGSIDLRAEARARAFSIPLDEINVADDQLYRTDTHWPYFERLRKDAPVHLYEHPQFGRFWSISRYHDIVAVDSNWQDFSSTGSIVLDDPADDFNTPMFIAMDPPKHDVQRKTVSPAVAPANMTRLEPMIREEAGRILDSLPIGEPFDWVDRVSMELTAMTLATLFGVPQADRRKLTRWSDVVMAQPGHGVVDSWEQKRTEMMEYGMYFLKLWNERVNAPPAGDLISMLAHGEETRGMDQFEYLGNVILLTIGGNDTTRNTISGSVYALNKNPDQYDKLRKDPELIPSMVSETIRWQTPLAHMRRTVTQDFEFQGKQMKKGDLVAMWYVSGNRDESAIEGDPNAYLIDRERPRHHVSFGFGIHRCVGNRVAELQLRVIWEEILKRFPDIQLIEEPKRVYSCFVKGYERMLVQIPKRN
jgi:cytochrome P450